MKAPREQRASGRNVNRDRPASDPFPCTANSQGPTSARTPSTCHPFPTLRSIPCTSAPATLPRALRYYQHDHRAAHNARRIVHSILSSGMAALLFLSPLAVPTAVRFSHQRRLANFKPFCERRWFKHRVRFYANFLCLIFYGREIDRQWTE